MVLYLAGVMDRASARTPPTQETFDHVMHANVMGAMMVVPQVATKVEEANGVFAFFSSQMGSLQNTRSSDAALYRISKAALNMVVRTAQHDYPRARMVAVHPGWVQTDMGGMQATLTPTQSVTQLRQTLASVTEAHQGQFVSFDVTPLPC